MDPFSGMIPDKDTSFAFMRASIARGHQVLHCEPLDLSLRDRQVFARVRPLHVRDQAPHCEAGAPERVSLEELDAIFIRKDPPFDRTYLYMTHQLEVVKDRTLVLNDPGALRDANEKLYAFNFAEFMPPSLVSANERELIDFVQEVGGRAVIKPLDGAGGSGVAALSTDDLNLKPLVGLLTKEGKRLALVQQFQPAVFEGDKRVLLLDGKLLGAIRRVPVGGDLRANIHVGGRVEATDLTAEEREMAASVGRRLREVGLWFVGLDLIGGKLIEVNVTSPTGIQELGRFTQSQPEHTVIEWVEQRVRAHGPS